MKKPKMYYGFENESNQRDRISDLPDCLLHRILSNLDTKLVVQISILSTRWKYIWTQIPFLKFRSQNKDAKRLSSDLCFVQQVLNQREPTKLIKFELSFPYALIEPRVMESILSYVMSVKAQEVALVFSKTSSTIRMELPKCFYDNHSLEKLQLNIPWLTLSNTTGFRALKELRLLSLDEGGLGNNRIYPVKRTVFCPDFFSNCPVLELLSFSDCYLHDSTLTISSPLLKNLEIQNSVFDRVVVSSPLLVYFKFEGKIPINLYMAGNCHTLEKVDIDVKNNNGHRKLLAKMLRQLENARFVSVSIDTLRVLSEECGKLENESPPFPNLNNLYVKTDWTLPEKGLSCLLSNSASKVETLIQVPKSLRPRLETFKII